MGTKWSYTNGAGQEIRLHDARLTELGIAQARAVNTFWRHALAELKTPAPQSYYVSPLDRALATAWHTFHDLEMPDDRPFQPVVKENLRETLGVHACDSRSPASYIRSTYPSYVIEPGFVEEDELFSPDIRETHRQMNVRFQRLLNEIFENDQSTFVSFTAHSGATMALLRVLKHREFALQTGGLIAVLVRADRAN